MSVSGGYDPLVRLIAELTDAGVELIVLGGAVSPCATGHGHP